MSDSFELADGAKRALLEIADRIERLAWRFNEEHDNYSDAQTLRNIANSPGRPMKAPDEEPTASDAVDESTKNVSSTYQASDAERVEAAAQDYHDHPGFTWMITMERHIAKEGFKAGVAWRDANPKPSAFAAPTGGFHSVNGGPAQFLSDGNEFVVKLDEKKPRETKPASLEFREEDYQKDADLFVGNDPVYSFMAGAHFAHDRAVKAAQAEVDGLYAALIGQEHRLGIEIEKLEKKLAAKDEEIEDLKQELYHPEYGLKTRLEKTEPKGGG